MNSSNFDHARLTVLAALISAFGGSLFGLIFGVGGGAVVGPEVWLIGSCAVFSSVFLLILLLRPFEQLPWITPAIGVSFLFYLSGGAVLAGVSKADIANFIVYLLWFYPLLAFNRFVIAPNVNRFVSQASIIVPLAIAASKFLADFSQGVFRPTLVVFCLSYLAFSIILNLFSRYREALIMEKERSVGLERAERLARTNEERFRIIAKATADTVWDWDLIKDTIWWSEGVRTLYGYEPAVGETEAESWNARLHPEDKDRVLNGIQSAIAAEGDNWLAEYRFLRADGSYADVSSRAFIIRTAGKAVRMVGGITDVSDLKALEAQLRHSKRLEAVGQLTGGVAHDFNNLLTVILGNTEMLSESLLDDAELGPLARGAYDAAGRGAELTKRLLAFARQQVLEPKALDVASTISGMQGLLRRTLKEDVDIEFVPGTVTLWQAFADAGQLENAVLNLAINARDAMPGGGKLTIEASNATLDDGFLLANEEVKPGDYIMVAVSDTGTGMTAEVLARAFEPFFTTKEVGSGNGLGLSMVYGYVRQSNGYIKIYSEVGHGTTVRLYLPRAEAGSEADVPVQVTTRSRGGSETILVVEDDRMVQEFVAGALRALGYTVTCVNNGVEARDILQSPQPFDLLFTDVVMPGGMNGKQLAEAAGIMRPDLPVLFTSGYTEDAIVHNGRLDRGVHLLNKPYSRAELAGKVRQALGDGP